MINDYYIMDGKGYALGGLTHGEIDNVRINSEGEGTVYDIFLDNGQSIALAEKYGLFINVSADNMVNKKICASQVRVGDKVTLNDLTCSRITKITKRKGTVINVPKDAFSLNGILVSSQCEARGEWTLKNIFGNSTRANSEASKKLPKK